MYILIFDPSPHDSMLTLFVDDPDLTGSSQQVSFFSSKYKVTKEKLYVLYTKHHYNVIQCPIKGDHNWITVWIVWAKQPSLRGRKNNELIISSFDLSPKPQCSVFRIHSYPNFIKLLYCQNMAYYSDIICFRQAATRHTLGQLRTTNSIFLIIILCKKPCHVFT